mgnify:CR=1 FL=1
MYKVAVLLSTYNGSKYIKEQIDSILSQEGVNIDIYIRDDGSTDETVNIIYEYKSNNIFLTEGKNIGVGNSFMELLYSVPEIYDYYAFADQDDVWLPNKIEELTQFLTKGDYDVVTCNCALTDINLNIIQNEYYTNKSPIDKSVWGNLVKDLWLGCCIAFRREILLATLPFPKKAAAHDLWIALYSQLHFKCGYYPKVLQLYRRHENTVSFAGGKSTHKLLYRINYRLYLVYHLLIRSIIKKQ